MPFSLCEWSRSRIFLPDPENIANEVTKSRENPKRLFALLPAAHGLAAAGLTVHAVGNICVELKLGRVLDARKFEIFKYDITYLVIVVLVIIIVVVIQIVVDVV